MTLFPGFHEMSAFSFNMPSSAQLRVDECIHRIYCTSDCATHSINGCTNRCAPYQSHGLGCGQAGDDFTSELVRIHETIEAEGGPRQPVCLAINRSDYMLHVPEDGVTPPHLLQVSHAKRPVGLTHRKIEVPRAHTGLLAGTRHCSQSMGQLEYSRCAKRFHRPKKGNRP